MVRFINLLKGSIEQGGVQVSLAQQYVPSRVNQKKYDQTNYQADFGPTPKFQRRRCNRFAQIAAPQFGNNNQTVGFYQILQKFLQHFADGDDGTASRLNCCWMVSTTA